MSVEVRLQAGGTLNPRRHLYIERQEDEKFFDLLEQAEYVNVLSSRQMGKSSLVIRAMQRLKERSVESVTIDLAAELGAPPDIDAFYLGLLSKISRILKLQIDLQTWWKERGSETVNQRLQRFFREIVGEATAGPVVIFLDEIDSTLKLPYTDDLFTAIRGMYNDRPMVEVYRRITFCLLGVATPNELIKDRRTTAYNIGTPLTLRDFDRDVDDLSPFLAVLNPNPDIASRLLDRILYWSGGQPYLTQKFCSDVVENRIDDVDQFLTHSYHNLGQASGDTHFQQILRFLQYRLSDEAATIELYARVLKGETVLDRTTLATAELKLSGLVKRSNSGNLVVRNPIYQRLFDGAWLKNTRPNRALSRARNYAIAASIALILLLGGGSAYYVNIVQSDQSRLAALDQLAAWQISITESKQGLRATFPHGADAELIKTAIPILKRAGSVTELGYGGDTSDENGRTGFRSELFDVSPLAELGKLRVLDLRGLQISDVGPLAGLSLLEELKIGYSRFDRPIEIIPLKNIDPLRRLISLRKLSVGSTSVSDLGPLASLAQLRYLDISNTKVSDLTPLAKLNLLDCLYAVKNPIQSLEPLSRSTSLRILGLEATKVYNFLPLSDLTNLVTLDLTDTNVVDLSLLSKLLQLKRLYLDGTLVSDVRPLSKLVNVEILWLNGTRVVDAAPLATLTNLIDLDLSETQVRDVEPLRALSNLRNLNLRNTKVPSDQVQLLRQILENTNIKGDLPSVPTATSPSPRP